MKYSISLLSVSLFLMSSKTITMDLGMPPNLAPTQAAAWIPENTRLDNASAQLRELKFQSARIDELLARNAPGGGARQAPMPFPPRQFVLPPAPTRANVPSPYPRITTNHLLIAAGLTYTFAEVTHAYESFTEEEKTNMGSFKLALLVGLRTGKNILSRPIQLAFLPIKLIRAQRSN